MENPENEVADETCTKEDGINCTTDRLDDKPKDSANADNTPYSILGLPIYILERS